MILGTSPGRRVRSSRILAGLTAGTTAAVLTIAGVSYAVLGNINPGAIEIDANDTANLYPGGVAADCDPNPFGTVVDWVKDCLPNTDAPSLVDSLATGVKTTAPNQTGAAAFGHWNGVRIVDGIAGADQDIFLTGGKENDLSTWNVGPGSIGSSKYDATQAYLANNNTDTFFGMERRGNNGTTAFDFEFNVNAPQQGSYLPNRSEDDVMITFEMQGSGGSGSAVAHYFLYDAALGKFVEEPFPIGTVETSINDVAVPAAPWGYVTSQGNWATGTLPRFEFAEARIDLTLLNGGEEFDPCVDASRFVQVRTRSSSTDNSDLKDTTKIFEYDFFAPEPPSTTLAGTCEQSFNFSSDVDNPSWEFTVSPDDVTAGVALEGAGATTLTGPSLPAGGAAVYASSDASGEVSVLLPDGIASATIQVSQTSASGSPGCEASASSQVTVYREMSATATLTPQCDNTFTYSGTASGGKGTLSYSWTFQKNVNGTWTDVGTSDSQSGTFQAPSQGAYRALLSVKDQADTGTGGSGKPQCEATATSNTVNVYDAVDGSISLVGDCDDTFAYSALGSGGKAPYTYEITIQKKVNGTWVDADPVINASDTIAEPGVDGTIDVDDLATGGDGLYRALVTITDSQGLDCTVDKTSNEITVVHALAASASKTSSNETTATLTGSSTGATSLQWQLFNGTTWVNIAGETSGTLDFSAFETQGSRSEVSFTYLGDTYNGGLYQVQLRLHSERTVNGQLCSADSAPVTVKKLIGVDP